jgi:hypothetical protein
VNTTQVFKTGPFARSGLFSFYVPLCAFGARVAVSFRLLRRAIDDEATATTGDYVGQRG